jgi:hypothetical protein
MIAAVTPLLLVLAGVAALAGGFLVLRSFGSEYRVGRLVAATPVVSIAAARALAGGPARFVAIAGRIDSEDDFEDEAHRPLVYRRTRLQVGRAFQLGRGRRWDTVDERIEAVNFEVREGPDSIVIDHAALGPGLVVVPRLSVGTAADAPDRLPADTAPETPVRLLVEQVSSVEHAIAMGVPVAAGDGSVRLTAGLGRPLIMTTLERGEAIRILAGGGTRRPLAAALGLGIGLVLVTAGLAWALFGAATGTALAASPTPSAAIGGDPRSSGQGPGLVGDPLFAVGIVVAIAVVAIVGTLAYVRFTGGRRT